MDQLAFLFSGQGDQYPGMGRAWAEKSPAAAQVFARCDALRPGTSAQCFAGSQEALCITRNTQPCLFAVELAAAAMLREAGIVPAATAGFSLGEVSAVVQAGLTDFETGFHLVCARGERMQQAAETTDAVMAAVLRLPEETVQALCADFPGVYPVNYNCPGQITVSGLRERMADFCAAVKQAGGRAVPLKVGGGFHAPFMAQAAQSFSDVLASVSFAPASIPLYANVTGQLYTDKPAELLSRQICRPVRWERLIRTMIADGITTFIEIGPGRTLTNMMKKIDPSVTVCSVADPDFDTEGFVC